VKFKLPVITSRRSITITLFVVAGRTKIAELVDELKCGYRDKDDDDLVGRTPSILTM
jgi:hypothetical protein